MEDFRHMRQGIHIRALNSEESEWLKPLQVTKKKKDKALLMLHGFSSSPAVYRKMIPLLQGYDAIVCPVLPGHADSIDAFSKVKYAEWTFGAEVACDILVQSYREVDVLGLSLGGLLACHLSEKYHLNHLYLLAPALALKLSMNVMLKTARAFAFLGFKQVRNRAGNLCHPEETEIAYRMLPITAIQEILSLIKNFQMNSPKCPVDVFLGSQDAVVDSYQVSKRFSRVKDVSIHWLKNSAHVLPLDNDVDQIIDCINAKSG